MLNLLSSSGQITGEILQMNNTSKNNKVIWKTDFDVMVFIIKNNSSHNYVQMVSNSLYKRNQTTEETAIKEIASKDQLINYMNLKNLFN